MELSEKIINDIASELELGMFVFYNKRTQEVISHPDMDSPYVEPELWQDVIDKVNNDLKNCIGFEPMDSPLEFKMMANFATTVQDESARNHIFSILENRKPFRNFNEYIHNSPYRQDWFDFKSESYRDYVRREARVYDI